MSYTSSKSILYQAQEVVCAILNADEALSGKVEFIPENQKDIDFAIKNALGRQGIVGIVMTPNATYVGTYQGETLVWDLRDFTVQVVENPAVNRPIPNSITALDAAIRSSECLAAPLLSTFGVYCPTTIDQGEDSGLLVAQAKFNTTVRAWHEPPLDPQKTYVKFEGSDEWIETALSGLVTDEQTYGYRQSTELKIGTLVTGLGSDSVYQWPKLTKIIFPTGWTGGMIDLTFGGSSTVTSLENFGNTSINNILTHVFVNFTALEEVEIPATVGMIEYRAFGGCSSLKRVKILGGDSISIEYDAFAGCDALEDFLVVGKTTEEVQQMQDYPWGIQNTSVIHGTD